MARNKDRPTEIRAYKCSWPGCGYKFQQEITYTKDLKGRSQVTCPMCRNGLKLEEGKVIKPMKEVKL